MNLSNIFVLLLYIIFVSVSLAFLLYPVLYGTDVSSKADISSTGNQENQEIKEDIEIKDKIKSLKASLKDIQLENQIGKLANQDYEILRAELLKEWAIYEKKLKK